MAAGQTKVMLRQRAPVPSRPCPAASPPSPVLTSDVLQRDGNGRGQLPWRAEGSVAQLLVGADACGTGSSGGVRVGRGPPGTAPLGTRHSPTMPEDLSSRWME